MSQNNDPMYNVTDNERTLMLTAKSIKGHRKSLDGVIIAPFQEDNARGIGYNLSASELVYSLKKGTMLPIHHNDDGRYIWIKPHDTILTLSYEYLRIPNNVAGVFHSRVRMVAQGLGNTSTTLDPGWRGMLLLCINNPTDKKIKLQISKKSDGVESPCGIITMVLWETVEGSKLSDSQLLRLDNPPMRADILSSLVSRPHRFRKSRHYYRFQELINGLMKFRTEDNDSIKRIHMIMDNLSCLEASVYAHNSGPEAIETMIKLRELLASNENDWGFRDVELKSRFEDLEKSIKGITSESVPPEIKSITPEFGKCIKHMHKECEYLILCEEVNQIHEFIHKYSNEYWERNTITNILCKYVLPYIPAILCTLLLLWILVLGNALEIDSFFSKISISFSPIVLSAIISFINKVSVTK